MSDTKISTIFTRLLICLGFYILIFLGFLNHLFFNPKSLNKNKKQKYKGLYNEFDEIYSHYVYRRVQDCWNRPISSPPGTEIILKERISLDNNWTFKFNGIFQRCINMSSFNYLGFATDADFEKCKNVVMDNGWSMCVPACLGVTGLNLELEQLTAEFLGVESVLTCGMGFTTNSNNLPCILSKNSLVLSDERNHASIIVGLKLSGATVRIYKHADFDHLEEELANAMIANDDKILGQKWTKIVIVTEGLYSMDGTIIDLPKLIELKKKYKAYLYIDDCHGVGVLGPHGRGIFDYYGCSPEDIDILMGTYSKAFASCGGYIAGKKNLIDHFRKNSSNSIYSSVISPPVAQKAIISIKKLMKGQNSKGNVLIHKIRKNTHYFRKGLIAMGLNVRGHEDSHIVPWILYSISAVSFVVRELKEYGIAVSGVAYPATSLYLARIRFNISAAHTKSQLNQVLLAIEQIVKKYGVK